MASLDSSPSMEVPELLHLASEHPELAETLRAQATPDECTVQISLLPPHSRRYVWRLYRRHYPDFALWLEEVNRRGGTLTEGALLQLRATDILTAVRAELNQVP